MLAHGNRPLPIAEGSAVYHEAGQNFILPNNCAVTNAMQQCPLALVPLDDGETWLRNKRGLTCNQADSFCNEYNFRNMYFRVGGERYGDVFIKKLRDIYVTEFANL